MSSESLEMNSESIDALLFGSSVTKTREVTRLDVEGDLGPNVFCSTELDSSEITLTVSNCEQAWSGRLTGVQLSALASKASMGREEYIKLTVSALSGSRNIPFVFAVSRLSSSELQLSWKKLLDDGVRFELGRITLRQEKSMRDVQCSLLEFLVGQVTALSSQVDTLKDLNGHLERQHQGVLSRLDTSLQLKDELEKDLFGKFLLILNSKKAKIRQLLESGRSTADDLETIKDEPTTPGKAPSTVSNPPTRDPSPPSSPLNKAPVKRRKREPVNRPVRAPLPPLVRARPPGRHKRTGRTPSQGDNMESEQLLELL